MSKKSLIAGTLVLTGASLITRLLGFAFRIYQSKVMGAEGMGLYQLLFPIYMLLWAASSAGIAIAISKMVAEELSKNKEGNALHILKTSLLLSLPISFTLSILLYIFAPFIATYYIQEPVTTLSLKILASCIPFMSTACCIRGYFQGRQQMSVTALAQIVEQTARMSAIYLLAGLMIPMGPQYVCALGVIGMCMGEVFSLIMSYLAFYFKKRKLQKEGAALHERTLHTRTTFNKLFYLSLPITANRFLTSGLQSFENILIPITLQQFGLNAHSALGLYGKFSGMALPLLLFPSMVTSSLATALVPAISEAVAMKNKSLLQSTLSKAIQFSALIGIGATALFLSFSKEIALAFYNLEDVGELLRLLAVICPFLYLQNILTGAMNGLGMQKKTFQTNIIGSLLCIAIILITIPKKGIIGFVLAMLFQSGFVSCMLLNHVLKSIDLPINLKDWLLLPSLAALAGSLATLYLHHHYFINILSPTLSMLISVCLLGSFYMIMLFMLGSLTIKDIRTFITH